MPLVWILKNDFILICSFILYLTLIITICYNIYDFLSLIWVCYKILVSSFFFYTDSLLAKKHKTMRIVVPCKMSPCKSVYLCKTDPACKSVAVQKSRHAKVTPRAKDSPWKSVPLCKSDPACKSDARAKVTRSLNLYTRKAWK